MRLWYIWSYVRCYFWRDFGRSVLSLSFRSWWNSIVCMEHGFSEIRLWVPELRSGIGSFLNRIWFQIWQMRGKKVLVLDPQLSGPLALIAQTSFLKVFFKSWENMRLILISLSRFGCIEAFVPPSDWCAEVKIVSLVLWITCASLRLLN